MESSKGAWIYPSYQHGCMHILNLSFILWPCLLGFPSRSGPDDGDPRPADHPVLRAEPDPQPPPAAASLQQWPPQRPGGPYLELVRLAIIKWFVYDLCTCVWFVPLYMICPFVYDLCLCIWFVPLCMICAFVYDLCSCVWFLCLCIWFVPLYIKSMCVWFHRKKEPRICDIFVKKGAFLKLYTNYIQDFEAATSQLQEACRKYPVFSTVVRDFEVCESLDIKPHIDIYAINLTEMMTYAQTQYLTIHCR